MVEAVAPPLTAFDCSCGRKVRDQFSEAPLLLTAHYCISKAERCALGERMFLKIKYCDVLM